jgi:hypothetical protein
LLAFDEPLPIYIGITKSFKLGLREEAGVWQKPGTLVDPSLRAFHFVQCRASRILLSEASHQDDWKERVSSWLRLPSPKI